MSEQRYQWLVETMAVVYLSSVMLLAAVAFAYSRPSSIFAIFSRDLGINLSADLFEILCLVGALAAPFLMLPQMRRLLPLWRRVFYVVCGLPLALYTVPVGWLVYRTGGSGLLFVVYIAIYFSFVVIAGAVYRPRFKEA